MAATGGTDVPTVATKKLRVKKNKLTGFTVSYLFVASVPVVLAQTITFTQPADTALSDSTVGMVASSSSGLAVTFTSTTTSTCTTSGGGATVTLVAAGTCMINADQAGNATFAAAPQVSRSFAVTSAPVSCATGGGAANTCVLGSVGPGGGRVFYVNEANPPNGKRYMEAAPTGWDGGPTGDPPAPWGCSGTSISEVETIGAANLSVIGSGQANTTAIVAGCGTAGIAARLANDYAGGPGDWFLPSEAELNQLCKYARSYDSSGMALVPAVQAEAVCDSTGTLVGGFAAGYYWSSSQLSSPSAWIQTFLNGMQDIENKDVTHRVRPVRAF